MASSRPTAPSVPTSLIATPGPPPRRTGRGPRRSSSRASACSGRAPGRASLDRLDQLQRDRRSTGRAGPSAPRDAGRAAGTRNPSAARYVYLIVCATPTISTGAPVALSRRMRLPTASASGQIVFGEVLVDDGDARRLRGVGRPKPAAPQDRNPHRLEEPSSTVSIVDAKASRSRGIWKPSGTKATRVEVVQPERRILRVGRALDSGRFPQRARPGARRSAASAPRRTARGADRIGPSARGSWRPPRTRTPRSRLCWKPRYIRNDAASSIRDMAICATTSALRPHRRLRPPSGSSSPSADLSPVTRSAARALERRRQAAEERAQDGQADARQQHARIHPERDRDGQLGRDLERAQQRDADVADGDPAQSAQQREDQALGQQQPDQPEAPGARSPGGRRSRASACGRGSDRRPAALVHATSSTAEREDREDDAELPVEVVGLRAHLELGPHRRAAVAVEPAGYSRSKFRASAASSFRACRRASSRLQARSHASARDRRGPRRSPSADRS